MSDSLITVIAIILTAVLLLVLPVMTMADRADDISKTDVETMTSNFVNEIRTIGKLTSEKYNKFVEELTSTGNTYDIEMEFKILDENPGKKSTQSAKDKIGEKTTGHTTAKITSQHGLFYSYLANSYSQKFAQDYLEANEQAIKNIKNIIDKEKIKCDFEYKNSYVYTTKKEDLKFIKKEQKAIENLGFNCEYVTKTGLPFEIEGAICFKNQAQFHPLKYLNGLCHCIAKNNNEIYTNSTVFDVQKENDFYITFSNNFNVKSKYVIVATHYPFINFPGFYFAKMYQSTSYLIAVDTKKTLFNGMYISATNPILSFRTANYNGKELLLIGGGEHKTGQPTSYQNSYGMLEEEAKKYSDPDKNLFELSVLMQFAKNGPEFYEYVVGRIKPEQLQQEAIQSTLKKIKERNQEFEKSYITPKSALKNALNTTSMEKVEEARAQEMTQENAREEEKENG